MKSAVVYVTVRMDILYPEDQLDINDILTGMDYEFTLDYDHRNDDGVELEDTEIVDWEVKEEK